MKTNKGIKKLKYNYQLGMIICLLLFANYFIYQIHVYHKWVVKDVVSSYETCRIFNREISGEKFCLKYAESGQYSPYPWWKAFFFIKIPWI